MSEKPESSPTAGPEIQARLQDVARMLRRSSPIDPAAQRALAELVEELSRTLRTQEVPAAEVTHLAESTAHLAEALHQQHDMGLLARARDRLERAVGNAEVQAPLTVGVARRLLHALANLGI